MKFMHTASGVLAIVGLGYLAGVGQSLLRERPVILGPATSSSQPSDQPTDEINETPDAVDPDQAPISTESPEESVSDPATENAETDSERDALLDAPVPDGMISLREAYQQWIDGAYFVDARHDYEFEAGRISGAAHLTAETIFTDEGEAEMQSIPPDAAVIIYCVGGEECDASHNTMALMQSFGFTNLMIMGVGYDEWNAAGLPIDTGVSP